MKKRISFLLFVLFCFSVNVHAECDHQWSEWIVDEASCGEDGVKTRYCYECDAEEKIILPATGEHAWGEWEIEKDPECFEKGRKCRQCKECYQYETEEIPEIGSHDWEPWNVIDEENCLNDGYSERYCKVCDEYEKKIIKSNPNKHEYSSWYAIRRSTALSKGIKERDCYVCGKEQRTYMPKLKAKVSLNKKSISVKRKKYYTLKIKSKTYGDKILKWKSKNFKIATVNSKGKVTGKKKGTTTVTLYMKSGVKATCTVKVK